MITIKDMQKGLNDLRKIGKVEPLGLYIQKDRYQFYKYKALDGHPNPENAGNGFTHPAEPVATKKGKGEIEGYPEFATFKESNVWARKVMEELGILDERRFIVEAAWIGDVPKEGEKGEINYIDLQRGGIDNDAEGVCPDELSTSQKKDYLKRKKIEREKTDAFMFSEELIRLRNGIGFSQAAAARFCYNVPLRTWESWESGVRNPPSYVKAFVIEKLKNKVCDLPK